jgi:hypothetical protein
MRRLVCVVELMYIFIEPNFPTDDLIQIQITQSRRFRPLQSPLHLAVVADRNWLNFQHYRLDPLMNRLDPRSFPGDLETGDWQ